jgi:hypothetical protein
VLATAIAAGAGTWSGSNSQEEDRTNAQAILDSHSARLMRRGLQVREALFQQVLPG